MSETPKKLLIVDDEKSIRGFLTLVAQRQFSMQTAEASNGQRAIDLLLHDDFDVVLSDFSMPEADGGELFEWIAVNRPHLKSNFILMTAYAGEEKVRQLLARTPTLTLLTKPFSTEELGRVLESRC